MICIPITSATHAEALGAIERSAPAADAIELRMDVIAAGDLPALMAAARRVSERVKIIVTCRRPEEALTPDADGIAAKKQGMTETAKMDLLKQAVALGADFIDIELACGEKAIKRLQSFVRRQKSPARIIVSWHDIAKTPSLKTLKTIFQACVETGADIVKIVPYARTGEDNLKVLGLLAHAKAQNRPVIAMCMGEEGKISRIMAPLLGSYLTFAVLPGGRQSAPGQLTVSAMRDFQNLLEGARRAIRPGPMPPDQPNFVLLGNPVRHSLSPLMHNRALAAMGIDGHYSAFCVSDLGDAIAGIRGMNIRGASVTIPFKTAVMEYLDAIDGDAAALGAVNTIVNDRGRLAGYNTDWLGFVQALKDQMDIPGKTFMILGAGGTARAAAYGISKEGGQVLIVNRTAERGRALADRFDCPFYPLAAIGKIKADCLINATSVGMYPQVEQSPVAASALAHYPVVADVIYNPLMTRLLRDAEAKGCKIISGLEMFVHQGAGQLKLWTGKEAPLALMRKTVRERLKKLAS